VLDSDAEEPALTNCHVSLTPRQCEVTALLVEFSNREVGDEVGNRAIWDVRY